MARKVRLSNPFRYGALALDESFADRERELGELTSDAASGQDIVIFAPRRFGKSSLVWRAAQQLVAGGALVAQIDLMATPTKERLAGKLAEAVFENVASVVERVREKALAPLRGLSVQPAVTIDPNDGSLRFRFAIGHEPTDIDATLERLFELPGELGSARDRRVVLVIDEFQEIVGLDPNLPRLMRSVFQRQPEVAHVYLGSKRHVMERIFNDVNEPFWRSAKAIELGGISAEDFAPFIRNRFDETGKDVSDDALEGLLSVTGGHPYATQELCFFLWDSVSPGKRASVGELEAALAAVLRAEDARFTGLWERLPAGQKVLLEALADGRGGRPLTTAFRRAHALPSVSTVQTALRALEARELVVRDGPEWIVAEPFLGEWVRANVSRSGRRND